MKKHKCPATGCDVKVGKEGCLCKFHAQRRRRGMPLDAPRRRNRGSGLTSKQHYQLHKDQYKKRALNWRREHKKKVAEISARYYQKNKEAIQLRLDVPKMRAYQKKRKLSAKRAAPPWLTSDHLFKMETIYRKAATLQKLLSIPMQVDHIIPLQGKDVCGLHVPWNLRAIPAEINQWKKNKLPPKEDWLACPA